MAAYRNPIGSIDKSDLKRFIAWAEVEFNLPCLHDFLTAIPTAEVRRIRPVEQRTNANICIAGADYRNLVSMVLVPRVHGSARKVLNYHNIRFLLSSTNALSVVSSLMKPTWA